MLYKITYHFADKRNQLYYTEAESVAEAVQKVVAAYPEPTLTTAVEQVFGKWVE